MKSRRVSAYLYICLLIELFTSCHFNLEGEYRRHSKRKAVELKSH